MSAWEIDWIDKIDGLDRFGGVLRDHTSKASRSDKFGGPEKFAGLSDW